MEAVQNFLSVIKTLARRYKVRLHPKDMHDLGATLDGGGQFECIISKDKVIVIREENNVAKE